MRALATSGAWVCQRVNGPDFLRDESGKRRVFGSTDKFQDNPHWRDNLLFFEYFHGDNGAGIGASHQTGWTDLVAALIELFGRTDAATFLQTGRMGAFRTSPDHALM